MKETVRLRAPWIAWAVTIVTLAATLALATVNGSLTGDTVFISLAILMMLGYTTVGALLASRVRGNPTGWLMMITGASFLVAALSDEYTVWALRTHPGSHPFVDVAIWLNNWIFILAIAPIPLILLLFPTGRVPSKRWRWLPPALVIGFALGALGTMLRNGPIDIDEGVRPLNPTGIAALDPIVAPLLVTVGFLGIGLSLLCVVALVLRFRSARGEERQQIRWLAYVALVGCAMFVLALVTSIGLRPGETRAINDLAFYGFFLSVGIGVPVATGIAVLRYRLWELDVVVKKTVVFAIVAASITLVYVAVLVALPAVVLGRGRSFSPLLFGTTIAIAVLFQPLRSRARRLADRIVYGKRATPYEVLSEFSERLSDSYSTEDVLPRLAQLLRDGTGATRSTVWLRVGSELVPAATAPGSVDPPSPLIARAEELPPFEPPAEAFPVRHRGELLGAISLDMPANDPMDPAKQRLVLDVASQAGLVLRNVRLIEELRASRRRIVAAQDIRAKKLERNIHDGAQQQLVALSVKLRLADLLVERDPAKARETLAQLQIETNGTLENLRDLARGIYPPLLADSGLPAALEAQGRKSPLPVRVDADGVGRYDREIEASVYFCCLEALNNVVKYADASVATIRLTASDSELAFEVADDGGGFDPSSAPRGTGLEGMADRLDAIGGTLDVRSLVGVGTTISGHIPTNRMRGSGG